MKFWINLPIILVLLFHIETSVWAAKSTNDTKTRALSRKPSSYEAKVVKLKATINSHPASPIPRSQLAAEYLKKNKFDDCIETLKPVYTQIDHEGLSTLERCYQGSEKYLNQIRVLEYMSSLEPRNLQTKTRLARAYYDIEKPEKSIQLLRELTSIHPTYQPAFETLYYIFQDEEDNYESRIILETMIQKFGKKPKWLTEICRLYAIDEFHSAAIDWCKQAVRLDNKIAENHVYLGFAYKGINNNSQGDKILIASGKQFEKSELALWAAGTISLTHNKYPVALGFFEKCVKASSDSIRCMIGLGKAAIEVGQFQKSLDIFLKACKDDASVLPQFKEATKDLYQKADPSWQKKFMDGHLTCRH